VSEEESTEENELPPEQEERIVDRVVDKVKSIVADLTGKPATVEEEVEEPPAAAVKEPTTIKEIETDMESQVRAALKKIGAEEEHAKEHEKLKAETERAPVQVGRVTRALWGTGE
jgi:hypothetical protein